MYNRRRLFSRLQHRAKIWWVGLVAGRRLTRLTRQIAGNAHPSPDLQPIAFVNISSRLTGMSLNAAFTLLSACGVQVAGLPVVYFGCNAGMSHCVLGTNRDDHTQPPPCKECIAQSRRLFAHTPVVWFEYASDDELASALEGLSVEELSTYEYSFPDLGKSLSEETGTIALGRLVLPSLRWALRRHHLPDDESTRYLLGEYILSAKNVAEEFISFLERVEPSAVVIFNGIMYPEAVTRWIAERRGIRVVTHEVGFQPFSAFYTHEQATAYPIEIPDEFELSEEQVVRLNSYLEKRFQGEFTMAGICFWPEMNGLDDVFLRKTEDFKQIVPVFTNVVYDTSQVHANVVFPHMFAWLDLTLEIIRNHLETLFVIRAHPDEMRPGTRKQSRESVQAWVEQHRVAELSNIVFINSQEYLSSYELIQRSKFIMVYNSSIGLEAALMGVVVLCGGKARYTQYPTVVFPNTSQAFREKAEHFLSADIQDAPPAEYAENARRFLYYQLFKASLPFSDYLENHPRPGFVRLRNFTWQQLSPEYSPTTRILVDGILHGKPFIIGES